MVNAASITVNSAGNVAGTTAALAVLGGDAQGESSLVYKWTVTQAAGPGTALFSSNGTNAAKNDTVTFTKAGVYGIMVTIVDGAETVGYQQCESHRRTGALGNCNGERTYRYRHQPAIAGADVRRPVRQADDLDCRADVDGDDAPFGGVGADLRHQQRHHDGNFRHGGHLRADGSAQRQHGVVHRDRDREANTYDDSRHARHRQRPDRRDAAIHAQGLDQFQRAMAAQPTFAWTAGGGTISSAGLYKAGSTTGTYSVVAKSGTISAAPR